MERQTKDEKNLKKMKKLDSKNNRKFSSKRQMKKRIKNSKLITNVKEIGEDGLIYLKSGEVATIIEIKAIDLSLTSNHEKNLFFSMLKSLYQIPNLNMKCYKLNEKLNLNANKVNLEGKIEKYANDDNKRILLEESRNLIDDLEEKNFTVSSIYYWVLIAKDTALLNKQLDELEDITLNIVPRIYIEGITNKLEIYKFLSNLYLTSNSLDELLWSDLPSLVCPMNISEKVDKLKFDEKEIQLLTVKNVPPFVSELFFEDIFNYPDVRASIGIQECITQEELIRWVNSQYQFLLTDRNTTKKLSDATELDTQKENFQALMQDIKNGDEKIKEISLILIVEGDRKHVMIIADEFHLFIDENNFEVLRNFGQLARRIRKYSGSLVVATQSVKDFVGSQSILRHSTAIFNNCQYQMIGMLKEDDLLAYLELFKQNPLTDTQKNFLMSARRGEFLLNIDSKNRLRIWVRATELEREMMGEK